MPEIRASVVELRGITRSTQGQGGQFQFDDFRNKRGFDFRMDMGFAEPEVVFSNPRYEERVKIARLVKAYGKALSELLAVGSADTMNPLFVSIAKNLQGLPRLPDDAKAMLQGLGEAAGPIAVLGVDAERLEYLREIVPRFDPAIQKVAKLIVEDFTTLEENTLGKYETAVNSAGLAVKEASGIAKTAAERAAVVNSAYRVSRHRDRAVELSTQLPEAAASMAKAHKALVEALSGRAFSFEDLKQFASEAERFYKLIHVFM